MRLFFFENTDFLFPFATKYLGPFHGKILSTYNIKIFLPEHLIQMAQQSVQDLLTAEATFLFRRLSSFKPNNHVTLVVINSRVTRPHPYFTCKSPYTVNLMKSGQNRRLNWQIIFHTPSIWILFMGLFLSAGSSGTKVMSLSLRIVSGTVMTTYLAVIISPCLFFKRILPPAFNMWLSSSAKKIVLTERENKYFLAESCKCFKTKRCIENRLYTVMSAF